MSRKRIIQITPFNNGEFLSRPDVPGEISVYVTYADGSYGPKRGYWLHVQPESVDRTSNPGLVIRSCKPQVGQRYLLEEAKRFSQSRLDKIEVPAGIVEQMLEVYGIKEEVRA